MNLPHFAPPYRCSLLLVVLAGLGMGLTGCMGRINVMGRDIPDSEYLADFDAQIDRERRHLEPGGHDEKGRIPSWDQYWCSTAATNPPTAQSRRLRRYFITHRRAAGLQELTCGVDYNPGSNMPTGPRGDIRFDHYYPSGDPRIFKW